MTYLEIEKLRIDGGTQLRVEIHQDTVEEYAEHLADLPESVVFFDGANYWLADGFHRYHAHRKKVAKKMPVKVIKGTQRDAILYAVGANAVHGLRRTNADKRKAIETMLRDEMWGSESNVFVAEKCAVSEFLVRQVRGELDGSKKVTNSIKSNLSIDCDDDFTLPQSPQTLPERSVTRNLGVPIQEAKPNGKPPRPRDQVGNELAESRVIEAFRRRDEINALMHEVSTIKSRVLAAVEAKDPLYGHINMSDVQADCANLYRTLKQTLPHALCSYCGGRNPQCRPCKGLGWLNEKSHDHFVPEDLKV